MDVDTQRLQQLGYDAVLGRDYTFWSSLCISTLNIGCLQVGQASSCVLIIRVPCMPSLACTTTADQS